MRRALIWVVVRMVQIEQSQQWTRERFKWIRVTWVSLYSFHSSSVLIEVVYIDLCVLRQVYSPWMNTGKFRRTTFRHIGLDRHVKCNPGAVYDVYFVFASQLSLRSRTELFVFLPTIGVSVVVQHLFLKSVHLLLTVEDT